MIIKKKIYLTIFIFFGLYLTLIGRSFYLQIYHRDELIRYADTQFVRAAKLYPQRGQILDRELTPLAVNVQKFDLYAMPQDMKSKSAIYEVCKIVSNLNCKDLYSKINQRKKFTWITRGVSLSARQLQSIKKIDGIYFEEKYSRFYPHKMLAAPLVGHLNIDNQGIAGVEYAFEHDLKGSLKEIKYFKDAKGRPIRIDDYQFGGKGKDVILSLDHELQAMTEKFLAEGIEEVNAKSGGALVLNAKSGEVLAMASLPSFDPNQYGKYASELRKSPILTDPFEPGSTFKIFTIAAGLEENLITPETKFFCENGKLQIGKHTVTEASGHKFGTLSVTDIFKNSSNIGTTKIAMSLGYNKLNNFIEKLNFGKQTGIELRGESRGIYKEIKKPSLIHLSNLSFGQGIATTPLQLTVAYAAIANDGLMPKPTILRRNAEETPVSRVMSVKTAKQLQKMLSVVVDDGTGFNAKISQFHIAGKTSTAQKVGADGRYTGIIAGFIGFPLNLDEKIIIYVYVDEPKTKIYGNDVAAPIFQKIMSYYLYQSQDIKPTKIANENMIVDRVANQQASILREKGKGTIPNFIGLDKVTAQELAQKNNMSVEIVGSGIVEKQLPAPYTPMNVNTKVSLYFKNPEY